MPIFDNNRELLDRFRRGDPTALAEVYEHYVDDIAMIARRGFTTESGRVAGVDIDGEHEIVQETFVKAFGEKARIAFDGIRPYRPYLVRIVKNVMIDRLRGQQPMINVDDVIDVVGVGIEPEPEDDLHWKALSTATAAFVAELDAESREIVRLRFEQDLSQDAVAAQLGCTRRRVRTLERRIASGLAKRLKRLGIAGR